jgi:hypothetical protein
LQYFDFCFSNKISTRLLRFEKNIDNKPDLGKKQCNISNMLSLQKPYIFITKITKVYNIEKKHGKTCPWRTRSHRFVDIDHKSGSPVPIGAGEDHKNQFPPVGRGEVRGSWSARGLSEKDRWRLAGRGRRQLAGGGGGGGGLGKGATGLVAAVESQGRRMVERERGQEERDNRSQGTIGRLMENISPFLFTV